ncbi:cholinesterase-like isoform X2 [Oculina patagonica]
MKLVSFRVLSISVTCAILLVSKLTRAELDEGQNSPVVQTESGAVVGKIETLPLGKSVHEYLGIPYAEPPIGELRFVAPNPVKPWSGIKQVTEFGASCIQIESLSMNFPWLPKSSPGKLSEDCLFLNVFVPSTIKPDDNMAVMVFIHGGGFAFGSSTFYHGGVLAGFNDVIVVTINYRLGVLGFFNIPGTDYEGNYGMLDQVQALKWVQTNIASFGGDPNRVTIFGESAGGMSVSLHLISPLSKGLFHRAIMQSGASSSPLYCGKVTKTEQLELFAKLTNCSLGPNHVDCVRVKSAEDILTVQGGLTLPHYTGTQDIVAPIVDGNFLPDLPEILFKTGQSHPDVDVIIGFNSNEGAMFAMLIPPELVKDGMEPHMFESFVNGGGLMYAREKSKIVEEMILLEYTNHADPNNKIAVRQAMMDTASHAYFVAPPLLEAKALSKGGQAPYVYLFDHRPVHRLVPDWMGVVHDMENGFVFGAPFKNISDPMLNMMVAKYSEIEKGLSLHIMKLWTDFAKYGSPNPTPSSPSPVTWPKFTEEEQEYLVLDVKPRVERRYQAERVTFWNEVVPKVLEGTKTEEKKAEEEKAPKDEL